ncbi:class I SAM-dependent methyltransferase [Brevibacterium samyangense]|uniref:Class I SAM-dependent methyltransferase n=2 Tax=Brevibacterium samyangense TaxID=366888 RepID=A0ABP5F0S3_9MICO
MVRPRMNAHTRTAHGRNFGANADLYEAVRPGYPAEALPVVLGQEDSVRPLRVLDLGAGTGKLTRALMADPGVAEVQAVDPDASLLALNPAPRAVGTAEDIPFPADSFDLVTVAQAWHWVDEARAAEEIARVLVPGGRLAILVNQLDVRVDWVLRLSRIMHAGDVYRPAWRPALGPAFGSVRPHEVPFVQEVTVDDVVALAATRSYWLRSDERIRARVESNLRGYFAEEHVVPPGETFDLPYLSLVHTAQTV